MIVAVDSSILIGSLRSDEAHHEACGRLLKKHRAFIRGHALAETFSVLTGGTLRIKMPAGVAADLIKRSILPYIRIIDLGDSDIIDAMVESQDRGVRGGAIYDYLHLCAARKAKAARFYTIDTNDFRAFHRKGDPEIHHPV